MKTHLCLILMLAVPLALRADDPKPAPKPADKKPDAPKPAEKKRSDKDPTFTDAVSAGIDFMMQGEYFGGAPGHQFGMQVIAQGEGEFRIRAYFGGLPGAGWSGDKALAKEWKGKLENNQVKFGDKDGESTIANGQVV